MLRLFSSVLILVLASCLPGSALGINEGRTPAGLPDLSFGDAFLSAHKIPDPPAAQAGCYSGGTLLDNIARAQMCLEHFAVSRERTKDGDLRRYVIAVLENAGGLIRIVHVLHGQGGLQVLTPGFILKVHRENGINSELHFSIPSDGLVLAVNYPLQEGPTRVYTPYSPAIAQPLVIQEGLRVQSEFIERALARLRENGTASRRFPGQLVADVISRELLAVLLVIEHIDPVDFTSAERAETLVNKVLVIIGANKKLAYAHVINGARASGLAQLTPGAYTTLLRGYPNAGLNPDFAAGAADPINAIMAQAVLCDHDWAMIQDYLSLEADRVGPYLAASYNCGVGCVIRSILKGDMSWLTKPALDRSPQFNPPPVKGKGKGRGAKKQKILPLETKNYVVFYHWVQAYLLKIGAPGFGSREGR